MKKCLYRKRSFEDVALLRDYYKNHHNVDTVNFFFKELFELQSNNLFAPTDCPRCGQFLKATKVRKVHNFFKHYDQEKCVPSENRPISTERFEGLRNYLFWPSRVLRLYSSRKYYWEYFESF